MSRLDAVKKFRETGQVSQSVMRRGNADYRAVEYYACREIWKAVAIVRTQREDERSNYEIIDEALKEWAEKRKE
jgi:hypothetical protein